MTKHREYLKETVFNSGFTENEHIKELALAIADFLCRRKKLDSETSFSFEEMKAAVPDADYADFVQAVMLLCADDVRLLARRYFAVHPVTGRHEDVSECAGDIDEMIESDSFYHPLSGENISREAFERYVSLLFVPTRKLLDSFRPAICLDAMKVFAPYSES